MNFTSQICTSRSQSERLLALGLKKETADCVIMYYDGWHIGEAEHFDFDKDPVEPAWSLHRLVELCGIDRMPINFYKKGKVRIKVNHIHPTHDGRSGYNHYDSLIDCIEWLIKEGYFYKEYLE